MRTMTFPRWPLLDLPVALFEVDHDGVGDLVLLVLSQRSAHATDQAEALPKAHHDAQPQLIGFAHMTF
jgi:hypothetical protein